MVRTFDQCRTHVFRMVCSATQVVMELQGINCVLIFRDVFGYVLTIKNVLLCNGLILV